MTILKFLVPLTPSKISNQYAKHFFEANVTMFKIFC